MAQQALNWDRSKSPVLPLLLCSVKMLIGPPIRCLSLTANINSTCGLAALPLLYWFRHITNRFNCCPAILLETYLTALLFNRDLWVRLIPNMWLIPVVAIHQVKTLTTAGTTLPILDNDWLLLWYGGNSHFVDTKHPLTYTGALWQNASLPHRYAYQGDAPILLLFENQPFSIKHADEGGVEIDFGSSTGYVTILPILGIDHPRVSQTECGLSLCQLGLRQKIQWWSESLCNFPIEVTETYSYNSMPLTLHLHH
jgi:hypothetical protein